jgi:hypothetical protein
MIKLLRRGVGLLFCFFSSCLRKVQAIGGRGELFNPIASRFLKCFSISFVLLLHSFSAQSVDGCCQELFVLLLHLNVKLDCDRADILFLECQREHSVSEIEPDSCRAVKPENFSRT